MPSQLSNADKRNEFASCYEAYFWRRGHAPTHVSELNSEFQTSFTETLWEHCFSTPSLVQYLQDRHVPVPDEARPALTKKQLDFLQKLFDPSDPSPLAAKLKAAKVTSAEYTSWMRDENFTALARSEANKRFSDGRTNVLLALEQEATLKRNVAAIKLYLTMTGDYSEAKSGVTVNVNQDMRLLTYRLLEVLQRHVPPETLALVAAEFEQVLFPKKPGLSSLTSSTLEVGAVETPKPPKQLLGSTFDGELTLE